MQLDDLQRAWAAHGALLERSLAINEKLLRDSTTRKVRFALAPYVLGRAFEVAVGVAGFLLFAPVVAKHLAEPRYLLAGGAVVAYFVAGTAFCAFLLVGALKLDYGGAVTAMQRDVERMQLVETRSFLLALLGGTVVWLPVLLLLFERATGVNALARIDLAFLVANLVVGLVLLAIGVVLSRVYVDRPGGGARARRWIDALSGRGLRRASAHLDELARFVKEEAPPA